MRVYAAASVGSTGADPTRDQAMEAIMQHELAQQRLIGLRAELQQSLATIVGSSPSMDGIGFGKRVGDGTGIAVERFAAVGAHEAISATMAEVEWAEQKLREGTYGVCDICGAPIPDERLEARPSATRCMLHPL